VVTADNTGAAQVLDTTSWSKIAEFEDSSGNILSASFNGWPQGPADRIVTVGRDNYVRIWDLHGTRLFQFQASKVKAAGCPGPQAQLLVRKGLGASLGLNTADQARFGPGGSGILVRYTGVSSGFLPLPVLGPNTVVQVASGSIVTFNDKGDCLDVDSGANRTMSMFSQDGRFVVTLSGNGVLGAPSDVKIFRVQDWSEISSNLSATSVYAVDCSAENLAVADSAGISVIGTKNGIPRPAPFSLTLSQFALSCDGKLLAGSGLNSGNLSVWNTFTGVRNDLSAPTGFLGLQFNPAATRLMAASGDRTIRVWEIPHKPVPQDHSWDSLMNYFAQTTRACLTAEQRHTLLGEEPFEAMQGFFECQKRLKF
jgi:WD40 repeat protein